MNTANIVRNENHVVKFVFYQQQKKLLTGVSKLTLVYVKVLWLWSECGSLLSFLIIIKSICSNFEV